MEPTQSAKVAPPKGHFYLAGRLFKRKKWWKESKMRVLYFYIASLVITNTWANGFDNSMMNGLQSLYYWQEYFNHPTGSLLGLFNCVLSVGSLIGLTFLPFALDRFGRKPCLIAGSCIMLIGIALQSASVNFGMFVAARLILGVGDIVVIVTGPLLITEIAPTQDRAILVSLSGALGYNSGAFVAAWVTYGTLQIENDWSWRAPSLLQSFFTILMLCVLYWIPESPRYYIARDQPEKAQEILAKYHGNGDPTDEIVQLEMAEIKSALELEKTHADSSYLDFFRTKGNRLRLIILVSIGVFSQLSGNGLVSYYLNLIMNSIGITSSQQQLGINGGLNTYNMVLNTFFSFFVNRWGRRPIFLISTAGMLISFVIWTILSYKYSMTPEASLGNGVLAMIFMYYLAYNMKSGLLYSYTTEILPYRLRAKGFTIMEYSVFITLFFNQYVNPIALENIAWKYYIFYCVFILFEIVVYYFFYPETRYIALEEVAKVFDGDDVVGAANEHLQKQSHAKMVSAVEVEHTV